MQVVVATVAEGAGGAGGEAGAGRGILGVIDGVLPKGVEGEEDIAKRKDFLRIIGYKG